MAKIGVFGAKHKGKATAQKLAAAKRGKAWTPSSRAAASGSQKNGAARNVGSQMLKMGGGPKCGPHRPGWRRCTVVEGGTSGAHLKSCVRGWVKCCGGEIGAENAQRLNVC